MKKIVLITLFVVLLITCGLGAEQRFMVDLTFYEDDREVSVDSIEVVETSQLSRLNEKDGNYQFQFKDSSGETLYEGKTVISFRSPGLPRPEADRDFTQIVDKQETYFVFNYDSRMKFFEIRNKGELVKRINLCRFHNKSAPNCSTDGQQIQDQGYGNILLLAATFLSVLVLIFYRRRTT